VWVTSVIPDRLATLLPVLNRPMFKAYRNTPPPFSAFSPGASFNAIHVAASLLPPVLAFLKPPPLEYSLLLSAQFLPPQARRFPSDGSCFEDSSSLFPHSMHLRRPVPRARLVYSLCGWIFFPCDFPRVLRSLYLNFSRS